MSNFTLPNNQFTTPAIAGYTRQPTTNGNLKLLKLVCMAIGHQPINFGNKQIIGTYPGTRKQLYVQHRVCKRCNCIVNSINTLVDNL